MWIALALKYWRYIATVAALASAYGWYKIQIRKAYTAGRTAVILEQKAEAARRNQDANAADAATRQCQLNPACRLSNDGYRRD